MGITLSDDNTVATKTGEGSSDAKVMLTRPAPDDKGNLIMTWRRTKGGTFGWALPDLDPDTDLAYGTDGSFICANGSLYGLGIQTRQELPGGTSAIPLGAALSLRYHPAHGTMHARVNGGVEVLCFTDLRNDLVPAVKLYKEGASCAVVVRMTKTFRLFDYVVFSIFILHITHN